MVGIYKITNQVNGKVYIGQSIDIEGRLYEHKYRAYYAKEGVYRSILSKAIYKYGVENFIFEVLEETTVDELDEREIYYIAFFNSIQPNGYNIEAGGRRHKLPSKSVIDKKTCNHCGGPCSYGSLHCKKCHVKYYSCIDKTKYLPKSQSQYTRKNLANKPTKEELYELLKIYSFNKVGEMFDVSGNAIKKWCKLYGIPHLRSEITPRAPKPKKEKVQSSKPVYKLDLKTEEVIEKYGSCIEAAHSIGVKKSSHICEACSGKLQQAYGFKWRYAED